MKKSKQIKKNRGIRTDRLAELQRATLIASSGASVRLEGSKVTNEEVGQVLNAMSKPSG